MNASLRLCALGAAALWLTGCVTSEKRPLPLSVATKAAVAVPETELLDIAIELFNPNVPDSEKAQEEQHIDPAVRTAEARFMPVLLADTLQGTGYWGQVRVVPRDASLLDVNVAGTIVVSNGSELKLSIKATDATGKVWLSKLYQGEPDTRTYKDGATIKRDTYQNVYVQIADDLATFRQKLKPADLTQIQRVAQLRFDAAVAPYAFEGYIKKDRSGSITAVRLPAEDDPLGGRLEQIREREYALLDTLDDHYRLSTERVGDSYTNWRKASYVEAEEVAELKAQATTRMLLGAAAVVGGIAAASGSNTTTADQVLGGIAVAGGIEAFKSGLGQRAEAKVHSESMKQQLASFSNEVAPMNVEVEGRTVELRGNAEQQFIEWRNMLKELYENETGGTTTATKATTGTTAVANRP
jgi:hypothetical protein